MRSVAIVLVCLASVARAEGEAEVKAFFSDFIARGNAFDPGVADVYADDARIIVLRDGSKRMEMTGQEWRRVLVRSVPMAKKRGDTTEYRDIEVSARDDGTYRVTATRVPAIKCVPDPSYYVDFRKVGESWQVVEEYAESVSLSRCDPPKALADALAAIRDGIVPHLPLDLDEDTRLEAVEVRGPNLIYRQRLHTVTAAEIDEKQMTAILGKLGLTYACGAPETKALIDDGATIRYTTLDRDGETLADIDIFPGLCP